jgi:hypothetical protein
MTLNTYGRCGSLTNAVRDLGGTQGDAFDCDPERRVAEAKAQGGERCRLTDCGGLERPLSVVRRIEGSNPPLRLSLS